MIETILAFLDVMALLCVLNLIAANRATYQCECVGLCKAYINCVTTHIPETLHDKSLPLNSSRQAQFIYQSLQSCKGRRLENHYCQANSILSHCCCKYLQLVQNKFKPIYRF